MNKPQWVFNSQAEDAVLELARDLKVSPLLARLLINRDITDPAQARAFLAPSLAALPSPHDFAGMDVAVARIREAIKNEEEISIQGDYDADGTCGSAILIRLFRMIGAKHSCQLPSRNGDGYGLSVNAINAAKERGVGVIITVDNGIAAVEEIAHAQEVGIDVIVTDHHRFGDELPPALALLHPGVPGSTYPHANLCGAGVAFKLAFALAEDIGDSLTTRPEFQRYLSFCLAMVAIASVADVVPLVGENRALTKAGLAALGASDYPAIQHLLRVARVDGDPTSTDVGFRIAPRINAAGRMNQERVALDLLLADDDIEASELAEQLDTLNKERQGVERGITKAAMAQIAENPEIGDADVLIVAGEGWSLGVLGITASRLCDKLGKPAIVLGIDEKGEIRGSGRAFKGFDLYHALEACSEHLTRFGGHKVAAGLSLTQETLPAFRAKMAEVAPTYREFLPATEMLKLDAIVAPQDLNTRLADEFALMEPFGKDNPEPLLALECGEVIGQPRLVGKTNKHLSFFLRLGESAGYKAIGFSLADELPLVESGRVNVAFVPRINSWNGRHDLELEIKAIAPAHR